MQLLTRQSTTSAVCMYIKPQLTFPSKNRMFTIGRGKISANISVVSIGYNVSPHERFVKGFSELNGEPTRDKVTWHI